MKHRMSYEVNLLCGRKGCSSILVSAPMETVSEAEEEVKARSHQQGWRGAFLGTETEECWICPVCFSQPSVTIQANVWNAFEEVKKLTDQLEKAKAVSESYARQRDGWRREFNGFLLKLEALVKKELTDQQP